MLAAGSRGIPTEDPLLSARAATDVAPPDGDEDGEDAGDGWCTRAQGDREADDAFIFLGTDKFTGEAGELRYQLNNKVTVVAGDVDGDGKADFKIDLSGKIDLTELDFVL